MLSKLFNTIFFQFLFFSFLAFGVVVCLFPGYFPFINWASNYAVQIMLLYLLLGILFLIFKKYRLVFMSFGCCTVLSLFLKFSSQDVQKVESSTVKITQMQAAGKNISLKVALFNIANSAQDLSSTISILRGTGADLLTIQEVNPIWASFLSDSLIDIYPNQQIMAGIGLFGMAIFSKKEILSVDTFYYQDLPNLALGIALDETCEKLVFVSSHMYPVLNASSFRHLKGHLETIEEYLLKIDAPVIAMGEYQAVSWSDEIQEFRKKTNLQDSRRGFMPSYTDGTLTFMDIPLDHIFFSPHFQCDNFVTLHGKTSYHLGIMGTYQIKIHSNDDPNPSQ